MATKKTGKPNTTPPTPPNYNYEWAKAIGTVRRAEEAKLGRQAQNAANQNAYNQAQTAARNDMMSRATKSSQPVEPGGGTRSVLEQLKSFMSGGLRKGAK